MQKRQHYPGSASRQIRMMQNKQHRPLIAILRGIRPHEAIDIANVLIESGFNQIEVPLNSPDPFDSIEQLVSHFGNVAQIGAGTVLTTEDVERLAKIGGRMVVSPNCNTEVIKATKAAGMSSYPGVLTPTECFAALDAGADGLKFFPAFVLGTSGVLALKSVLPEATETYAVGGVDADNFSQWLEVGVTGFGVGSSLYKKGYTAEQVRSNAMDMIAAYDACMM